MRNRDLFKNTTKHPEIKGFCDAICDARKNAPESVRGNLSKSDGGILEKAAVFSAAIEKAADFDGPALDDEKKQEALERDEAVALFV